ncbi:D-alanyl-D-alanine carboxypeptidase, partial [Clostridiaceae bacterium UIB06]|nr:D-alanyl-D-alanine carboxypeptidase [Clostridiaceae bacterium UIB06]
MRKRIRWICSFILFIFLVGLCTPHKIKALTMSNNMNVDARCAIALDSRSKIVLYEKNA